MTQPFVEYREVDLSAPLRQGDVLESADAAAPRWRRTLVVLTADCDLAHDKNRGRLTCIPLLEQDDYLLDLAMPRIREKAQGRAVRELQELLRGHGLDISDERLIAWVAEEDEASVTSALGLGADKMEATTRAVRALHMAGTSHATVHQCIDSLVEAHMLARQPPKTESARKQIVNSLRESFTNPPGDALFLSSIARGRHDGYFAYLRHIEQVMQPTVATGPTQRSAEYRRISRLRDRYAHALVQRFAMVFLSIGLPMEYEEVRNLHADLVGEQ